MAGTRISDMTTVASLPEDALVPVISASTGNSNYKYNLGQQDARDDTGAVSRPRAEVLAEQPYRIEDFGGGASKTGAENDAAWALLRTAVTAASRGDIFFGPYTYDFDSSVTLPSPARALMIRGAGRNRTNLVVSDEDADVLAFADDGQLAHSTCIEDLSLTGAGDDTGGTGRGIGVAAGHPESFAIEIRRVWIGEVPSDGINLGSTFFTIRIEDVDIDEIGGHGIVGGNNTWVLDRCYIHNLRTAGKAGYRLAGAQATMIACNGLDGGDVWGDFGDSTADGAASDAFANITMIGCNVESFAATGVRLRAGALTLINTSFISAAAAVDARALWLRPTFGGGFINRVSAIQAGAGATWAEDAAIHVRNGRTPFAYAGGGQDDATAYYEVYDEVAVGLARVPLDRVMGVGYLDGGTYHYAKEYHALRVPGYLLLTGLANAANDAAAAALNVPVGAAYRNGSVVMVRVA